jgi:hypothetical protein
MLLPVYFYEDLIDAEGIAIASMLSLQAAAINGSELDASDPDRFPSDGDSSFREQIFNISMAEVESEAVPDSVADDIWWEMMAVKYSFANFGNIGYLAIPYRVLLC